MTFFGSDSGKLRAWGERCTGAASTIEQLIAQLQAQVMREDAWQGPDADAFRGSFAQTVTARAQQVSRALAERGSESVGHADEQDEASQADAGSPLDLLAGAAPMFGFGPTAMDASGGWFDHRGDERSGRRGESRENSARNDGDEGHDPNAENPNARFSTPGPPATKPGEPGLGEGVPGTSADAPPPSAWTPPADGAGEYDSEFAGPIDHSVHSLAREGADLKRGDWPHAAENLDHFLDNTGEDKPADVDALLRDEPDVAANAEERRHQAGHDAVARAKAEGATGPVTYPLSTAWDGHTVPDGHDWFYASGSFNYNQTGTVTAYPPDANNPEWRYEVNTQVNFRDRYNWDGGKSTEIMGITVTDESLAALHRGGIAKEYNLVGSSSQQTTTGTA